MVCWLSCLYSFVCGQVADGSLSVARLSSSQEQAQGLEKVLVCYMHMVQVLIWYRCLKLFCHGNDMFVLRIEHHDDLGSSGNTRSQGISSHICIVDLVFLRYSQQCDGKTISWWCYLHDKNPFPKTGNTLYWSELCSYSLCSCIFENWKDCFCIEMWLCFFSAACAHAFFRAGSKLILCARREEELLRVKNDLIATRGVSDSYILL